MYIDVKETMWYRYYIDEEEELDINDSNIRNAVEKLMSNSYDGEHLLDTAENMSVEENHGWATIEVYDKDDNLIWDNTQQ